MLLLLLLLSHFSHVRLLCDPIDGSPPGSSIHGILQSRTLEWVAISFSNEWKWKVKVKLLSCVRLFMTQWTAATRLLCPVFANSSATSCPASSSYPSLWKSSPVSKLVTVPQVWFFYIPLSTQILKFLINQSKALCCLIFCLFSVMLKTWPNPSLSTPSSPTPHVTIRLCMFLLLTTSFQHVRPH